MTIPLSLAALAAASIIGIGAFYLVSPQRMTPSFGLKPPAQDADTRAWLRLKGVRDIVSGLVVLTVMLVANQKIVGAVLLVEGFTALGDMCVVLVSGGSKSTAFSVHGLTFAVLLAVGSWLLIGG